MVTLATFGPCGVVVPHVHPRANEFLLITEGEASFSYVTEVGLVEGEASNPPIQGRLSKGQGVLFPQGAIHTLVNDGPDCKPVTAVVSLSNSDPGTTPMVQMPAGASGNATNVPRQVDGTNVELLFPVLPPVLVEAAKKCLARCNIA